MPLTNPFDTTPIDRDIRQRVPDRSVGDRLTAIEQELVALRRAAGAATAYIQHTTHVDRFVHSVNGSDSNTGTSRTNAWLTMAKAMTELAVPGNGITRLILLTRDAPLILSTSFQIGANAAGLHIVSGTDDYADLRANKVLTKSAFFQPDAVSFPYVWATTDTQARSVFCERGDSAADKLIWYTHPLGASFAAVASSLNTTPGSFWTDGTTMYFRPLTGNDPVNDSAEYLRSYVYNNATEHGFMVNTYATIQGVMIGGSCVAGPASAADQGDGGYCLRVNPGAGLTTIRDTYLYFGGKHCLGLISGSVGAEVLVEDVRAEQATAYGDQTAFVSYANGTSGLRHTYRRVLCDKNAGLAGSMDGQIVTAWPVLLNHNAGGGDEFTRISVEDCHFPGHDISDLGGVVADGYTIESSRFGAFVGTARINRCHIDTKAAAPYDATGSVYITNTLMTPTITPSSSIAAFRAHGTLHLDGCTVDLDDVSPTVTQALYWRFGALNFAFRNGIFKATVVSSNSNSALLANALSTDTIDIDNNDYYQTATNKYILWPYNDGSTNVPRTLAQMQALGFDANSVNANPLLNSDYTPTVASPAVGLADSDLTEDKRGVVASRTTAGAYEV